VPAHRAITLRDLLTFRFGFGTIVAPPGTYPIQEALSALAIRDSNALGAPAWILFAIVFFWTPPHSWALSLVYRRDYAGADVPMLPAIASERATLRAILAYLVVLVVVSLLPAFALGPAYAIPVAGLNAYYLVLAVRTLRASSMRGAARLFHYSLVYLAAVFALCAATALLGG